MVIQRIKGTSQRILRYFASLEARSTLLINHKTTGYFKYPLLEKCLLLKMIVVKDALSEYNSYKQPFMLLIQ
jgi:hypothetical protein